MSVVHDWLSADASGAPTPWLPTLRANGIDANQGRTRRRGRRQQPTDWDDIFAIGTPHVAADRLTVAQVPALEKWHGAGPLARSSTRPFIRSPARLLALGHVMMAATRHAPDLDYLAEHLPVAAVHMSAQPTVQMMSLVQPLGRLDGVTWHRPWRERNISTRSLFGKPELTADGWPYYMKDVAELPPALRTDLRNLLSMLRSPFVQTLETNLWAGVAGVSSPLHHDAAHNVYAQLVGRKRFVLFAPDESPYLYVYPRMHPSTRQSQVDLRAIPPARFPRLLSRRASWAPRAAAEGQRRALLANATAEAEADGVADAAAETLDEEHREADGRWAPACEVILEPGDRLYIPPYWWHRASVVGNVTAVSVASYSQSFAMVV